MKNHITENINPEVEIKRRCRYARTTIEKNEETCNRKVIKFRDPKKITEMLYLAYSIIWHSLKSQHTFLEQSNISNYAKCGFIFLC